MEKFWFLKFQHKTEINRDTNWLTANAIIVVETTLNKTHIGPRTLQTHK